VGAAGASKQDATQIAPREVTQLKMREPKEREKQID